MKYDEEDYKGKISTKKTQKMLTEEGLNVTFEQAEEILYFFRKLANNQVLRYLEKNANSKNK
jgi:hypothetical protein